MTNELDQIIKFLSTKIFCGIGYVVIPTDVGRLDYIQTCMAKETISIYPETGGTSYNEVPISVSALRDIEFPEEGTRFGSQVIYLLHPTHRTPIVIAVIDKLNETINLGWKEFKLSKTVDNNEVTILGDAKQGSLFITVNSQKDIGGEIYLKVIKGDKAGKLDINVQGDIIFVCKNFTLKSENIILKNKTVRILSNTKISLGMSEYEPAVLGNTLKDILGELIDAIEAITVPTALGPSGTPMNKASFIAIKNKLKDFLSEKVELE